MKKEFITSLFVITTIEFPLSRASGDTGNGKGCFYNGRYHKSTWEEGCQYICTCMNTETGYFRCSRRCPVYKDIPAGCKLQLPPAEPCCMVPVCNDTTTLDATTIVSTTTTVPESVFQNENNHNTRASNMKLFKPNTDNTSIDTAIVNDNVSSNSNENFNNTIAITHDVHNQRVSDGNPVEHLVSQERNPVDIHEIKGTEMGNLMSIEELTPIDIAPSREIFIELPIMDELVSTGHHETNSSDKTPESGNENPATEKTKHLHKDGQLSLPILPHPLKDIIPDLSQDLILTPKDVIYPASSTVDPTQVSLNISENVLFDSFDNTTHITGGRTEQRPSFLNDSTSNAAYGDMVSENSFRTDKVNNETALIVGEDNNINVTLTLSQDINDIKNGSEIRDESVSPTATGHQNLSSASRQNHHANSTETVVISSNEYPGKGGNSNTVTKTLNKFSKIRIEDIAVRRGRCEFMGMRFQYQQTWFDGCNQFCVCLNARTGLYNCTKSCPVYKSLPKDCVMKTLTRGCCPEPECRESAELFRNTKLPSDVRRLLTAKITEAPKRPIIRKSSRKGSRNTRFRTIHTATGTYRLQDGGGSARTRVGRLVPASPRNNTADTNNIISGKNYSTLLQTVLGFCLYNGRRYKPGDRWQIGCQLLCQCLPGLQGQYACQRRCRKYNVVPFGCSLLKHPRDPCCRTLRCLNTTNADNTAIIGTDTSFTNQRDSNLIREMDNKTTALQNRNRRIYLRAMLLNRTMFSNSSSGKNVSLQQVSTRNNLSVLSAERDGFTEPRRRNHTRHHPSPPAVSQTGAVLISKHSKTRPIQIIATTGCVVGSKVYRRGQSWKIGCQFRCFCKDEVKQTMICTHLCPKWQLPPACSLQHPPEGKCCPVPKCAPGYRIKYPDGYIQL